MYATSHRGAESTFEQISARYECRFRAAQTEAEPHSNCPSERARNGISATLDRLA